VDEKGILASFKGARISSMRDVEFSRNVSGYNVCVRTGVRESEEKASLSPVIRSPFNTLSIILDITKQPRSCTYT
jgi:hypothetical protein